MATAVLSAKRPQRKAAAQISLRLPEKGVTYSLKAFMDLCKLNPELDFERNADGSVIIVTPPVGGSGRRSGQVYGQLFVWAMNDGSGEPFDASTGFTLPNGAVRSPDASWISSKRWDALSEEQQDTFTNLAPDFVAEVRSKSDKLTTLRKKMAEYIQQGVRLGWLIDPITKTVEIYRASQPPQRFENLKTLRAGSELPGFVLDLKPIWARKSH